MAWTRLDSVVQVRERAEDRATQALAKAQGAVRAAQARLEEATARAAADHRARTDVSEWEVQELAQRRAIVEQRKAAEALAASERAAQAVRAEYVQARQKAEVVRRVAESRRAEARQQASRAEDKHLDEVAALMFVRKAG